MKPDTTAEFAALLHRAQEQLTDPDIPASAAPEIRHLLRTINTYQLALELQLQDQRSNDALWRIALEASGDGLWDWDITSGIVSYSSFWRGPDGLNRDELSVHYDEWMARVHPDDWPQTLNALQDHIEAKTDIFINSHRLRNKYGSYQWVLSRGKAVARDSNNHALRMVGTHTDIGVYKKAEEALNTSMRMLEASQSIAKVGSVEIDPATQSLIWSAETYRIHDTSPEEYTPVFDGNFESYTEESRPRIKAALEGLLREGTLFDLELEKYTMRGRKINVRTTCLPVYEHGKTVKYTGIFQDITEPKARERLLKEKDELLSESQRIAQIGSWNWDLRSNEMRWSEETYRLYGVSPDNFTPNADAFFDLLHPEDRKLLRDWCLDCIAGNPQEQLVFRVKLPNGGVRIINGLGYLERSKDGSPMRMVGTVQNITEQRQAELRQSHHNNILALLAERAPLQRILETMTRDIETINPAMICSILLLDEQGQHLSHGAAPSLPEFYVQAINGETIGLGKGSCGTAAFTGERAIVEDIATHPWWEPYRELAINVGLAACWSQPIISSTGRVLGTFAIYHRYPCSPTAEDLALIETEARLATHAIERTAAEARLELAASVFTHAREAILITDALGRIVDVNETFTQITGYQHLEVLGQNPRMFRSGRHSMEFFAHMWRDLLGNDYWSGELWNKRKDGSIYATMATISAVRNAAGEIIHYVSLFTDITPLKEHQRQLEYIAHYDALTSLPNRVLLADRLKHAIAHCHRTNCSLAVLYLDLDGFKAVNDTHGHNVGDELLVTLSVRLKMALRDGDTLARIGGDEFVIVLTDLHMPEDYEPILHRLLEAASAPVIINQRALRVSASIGVTLHPQDNGDADQLMGHADQAMYMAKQAGKNCYHLFDVARDVAVKTHRESLDNIRQALDQRQFILHYQPKVNMRSGDLIGVEALIRWQHPTDGLLEPARFLPVIEDSHISIDLGDWVIDRALTQMGEWSQLGLNISVSVNVSALQLQRNDFAHRLAELLALHPNVKPRQLTLEIVETSALDNLTEIAYLIQDCTDLGVEFAVDDFGTGYSSLTYLRRLPARMLKIDQTFVRGMLDDPDDLAIVKGVIGLAQAFHRDVIAEGVESMAHAELLLANGCELGQGFGIAPPMHANALPDWVMQWQSQPGLLGAQPSAIV